MAGRAAKTPFVPGNTQSKMPKMPERKSIEVRKIANGYVARHTTDKSDGSYSSKEVYHPTKPTVKVSVSPKRGK